MPWNYVDATNLSIHERRQWIKMSKSFGYEVQAVFFDVPLEVCLERNSKRERSVSEDVMRKMAEKLKPPVRRFIADQIGNVTFQTGQYQIRTGQPLYLQNLNCHCFDPQTTQVLNPNAWVNPPNGQFGTSAGGVQSHQDELPPFAALHDVSLRIWPRERAFPLSGSIRESGLCSASPPANIYPACASGGLAIGCGIPTRRSANWHSNAATPTRPPSPASSINRLALRPAPIGWRRRAAANGELRLGSDRAGA